MKTNLFRISPLVAAICGFAAQPLVANADFALEEIVVTAQKRAESLQDVPIAVNAIDGDSLTMSGASGIEHLAVAVPGINITRQATATMIYLRGVGTTGGQAGLDSAVSMFQDGVLLPSLSGATLMFNNIERIEVLKGPQGTLYGRNATGGAINIVTKEPSSEFSGSVEVGYGAYDTKTVNAYLTAPLSDSVAADVAIYSSDQGEGYGENIITGNDTNYREDKGIRSKVIISPTETLDITLAGDYNEASGAIGAAYRPINDSPTLDGGTGWSGDFYDIQSDFDGEMRYNDSWGLSGRIDYDLGWATLSSITAYRELESAFISDNDVTALPLLKVDLEESNEQFTQELQLTGYLENGGSWIAGLYYLDGTSAYDQFRLEGGVFAALPVPGPVPIFATDHYATMDTKSYAVFGQTSYPISDSSNLTVGLRYTKDEREIEAFGGFEDAAGNLLVPYISADPVLQTAYTDDADFDEVTWRLAVDHQLTEDAMIYASYSRGFKSGVYNLTAPTDEILDPEILDAYEIGLKSELFDNRLRLNAAIFHYAYDALQVSIIEGASQKILNAAEAEITGIDFDFVAALSETLTISGGGAWLDATYSSFEDAPLATADPTYSTGAAIILSSSDASDNRLIRTPEVSLNLSLDYANDISLGEVWANLTYAWQNDYAFEPDHVLKQDAYGLLNFAAGINAIANTNFSAKVWARNLTDEEYLNQANASPYAFLGAAGEPRTYGVTVGYDF